ncbi:DUF397 domain-containing protein [Streptomyces radicis]|uniref:DUF397 domain-containing protein n=1 Tax=Streptomyces radicis TaxID=1750517 RepID=A0A3A9W7H2_9ACTN|nr:DUF397 domain-containing protein [Streptomyces radicis]RKN05244.1 DUF397 domain-containing protein [Streptomyces radicis]RKN16777.1 DUF397 domain-containing protein [Streptomyces radicis]
MDTTRHPHADVAWHKSSYSGSDNGCVERGRLGSGQHAVRDTKDRTRGMLVFQPDNWQSFIDAVRHGGL